MLIQPYISVCFVQSAHATLLLAPPLLSPMKYVLSLLLTRLRSGPSKCRPPGMSTLSDEGPIFTTTCDGREETNKWPMLVVWHHTQLLAGVLWTPFIAAASDPMIE